MAEDEVKPPSITVFGLGHVRVEPDEALLWLRLSRLESSSEKALREVAKRSEALQREIDALEIPSADRSSLGVSVHEVTEWQKNRLVHKGFRAVTVVRLRLSDPDLISRLITSATAEAEAEVDRLQWRVSKESAVRMEACRRAAEDARHRAEAYADGLGVTLGPVERVVGSGASPPQFARAEFLGGDRVLARSRSSAPPEPEVDVHPGEQEITADVEVTFRLGAAP